MGLFSRLFKKESVTAKTLVAESIIPPDEWDVARKACYKRILSGAKVDIEDAFAFIDEDTDVSTDVLRALCMSCVQTSNYKTKTNDPKYFDPTYFDLVRTLIAYTVGQNSDNSACGRLSYGFMKDVIRFSSDVNAVSAISTLTPDDITPFVDTYDEAQFDALVELARTRYGVIG